MNATIASVIKARVMDLDFIDKLAGLVRALRIERDGKVIIRPIGCDVEDPEACSEGELQDLVPDEKYATVIYFEDQGVTQARSRTKGVVYQSRLRLVC